MDDIKIRYGQTDDYAIVSDDLTAVEAVLYVGKPGERAVINKSTPLTLGQGTIHLTSLNTSIPLGEYKYQINIVLANGNIDKYPDPTDCDDCSDDDGLPNFTVVEALDSIEET